MAVPARAFQGLAVGMISGAATAALVELDTGGGQRPAMLAGLAQAAGSGLGPLVTGVLATWLPEPRRLSFLALLAATAVAAVLVVRVPEPARTGAEPWRIQRPRVPPEIAVDFARVGLTAAVAWASVALFLSIVPSYASDLLNTGNLALLGAVSAIALAASCVTLVSSTRRGCRDVRRGQAAGLGLITCGLAGLALAAPVGSLAVLVLAAVATGAGHGLAFLNAQDELNQIAPAARRGEVTAAFICCIYALVGGAVVAAGLLDRWASLSVAVGEVAIALASLAAATAVWQRRRG